MSVLVVSHDAGGANILSSWVKQNSKKHSMVTCLGGPARDIFMRHSKTLGSIPMSQYFDRDLAPDDFVLTGTSDVSDLERSAVAEAKRRGVRCASFLDHWVNYRQRFIPSQARAQQKRLFKTGGWKAYLPDEVWVGDKPAYRMAIKEGFPKDKLRLVENPYLEEIKALSKKGGVQKKTGKKTVLYMSAPICDDWEEKYGTRGAWKFDEFDQMEMFLRHLEKINGKVKKVVLRFHPKERSDKYDAILERCSGQIHVEKSKHAKLFEDIRRSDVVIGNESMGLVVAVFMGKKVFCCLPGRIKTIAIPYKGITRINSAEEMDRYL